MSCLQLDGVARLWYGKDDGIAQTRLFRKRFDASAGDSAAVALYADTSYRVWCNGAFINRGPVYHHPHRRPIETYDLSEYIRDGENVIAVMVYSAGMHLHNYVDTQTPGLVVRLHVGGRIMDGDSTWRVMEETGWSADVPRRTWAIGHVEQYDANVAPIGWLLPGYDDSDWLPAQMHAAFGKNASGIYQRTGMPRLRHWFVAASPLALHATASDLLKLNVEMSPHEFGSALDSEPWQPPVHCRQADTLTLRDLHAREAAVWVLDLGAEYSGSVTFDFESDSGGTIDVGWSELIEDGRPPILRKGGSYADRYIARPGSNQWQSHGYNAARYITLVLRGFTGDVRFARVGMTASEPDMPWHGAFTCSDPQLNDVWQLCERTLRVGVQEGLIDCPSREQAVYVGDANPIAAWIGRVTGDWSHWRYLVRETFASQSPGGLIKTTVFSGYSSYLVDYQLLAITGARDYMRASGDRETIDAVLPAVLRLLAWFDRHLTDDGLLDFDWEKRSTFSELTNNMDGGGWNVFIDHAGLGWHNVGEPGIDRRGKNAALHALLAMAWDAAAEMSGDDQWRRRADDMRQIIRDQFWDARRQLFVDGRYNGRQLEQISEQTNTWCALAGCVDLDQAKDIFERLANPNLPNIARCGPYFWSYMIELLCRLDMSAQAMERVSNLWAGMIHRGATTAFETFAGDELDSLCHPWACVPVDFLPRHIVGIGSPQQGNVELRPMINLLRTAEATVVTPAGPITLGWDQQHVYGSLPSGMTGTLVMPNDSIIEVAGEHRTPLAALDSVN